MHFKWKFHFIKNIPVQVCIIILHLFNVAHLYFITNLRVICLNFEAAKAIIKLSIFKKDLHHRKENLKNITLYAKGKFHKISLRSHWVEMNTLEETHPLKGKQCILASCLPIYRKWSRSQHMVQGSSRPFHGVHKVRIIFTVI